MRIPLHKTGYCIYCGKAAKGFDHVFPVSKMTEDDDEILVQSCLRCNMIAGNRVFETLGDRIDFVQIKLEEKGECNLPKALPQIRYVRTVGGHFPLSDWIGESSAAKIADMNTIAEYARELKRKKLERQHLEPLMCKACGTTWWEYSSDTVHCSRNFCPLGEKILEMENVIHRKMRA